MPAAATSAEDRSQLDAAERALLAAAARPAAPASPVILVTDGFHLARAWASFRWAGYPQVGLAAASAFGRRRCREQAGAAAARPSPGGSTSPASRHYQVLMRSRRAGSAPVEMLPLNARAPVHPEMVRTAAVAR